MEKPQSPISFHRQQLTTFLLLIQSSYVTNQTVTALSLLSTQTDSVSAHCILGLSAHFKSIHFLLPSSHPHIRTVTYDDSSSHPPNCWPWLCPFLLLSTDLNSESPPVRSSLSLSPKITSMLAVAGVAPSVSPGTFFSGSSVVISLLKQNPSRRWRPCFLRVAVTGFYSEQILINVYSFFTEHQDQPEEQFYSYLGWKIEFVGMICRLMDQRLLVGACVTLKPL